METAESYHTDVYAEALNNNMMLHLSKREQHERAMAAATLLPLTLPVPSVIAYVS